MNNLFNSEMENFLLIAEHKSLSAVSRRTGQDVGSLSRSLARLEADLGKSLFTRLNTGLNLTPDGEKILAAIRAGKQSFLTELTSFSSGKIRIGFSAAVGFGSFKKTHLKLLREQELTPEFHIEPTIKLFEMLKARELDLVIAPKKLNFPECINVSLESDKIVLVSSTGQMTKTLLHNSQMLEIEKVLKKLKYESIWEMQDYFVMAKFLSLDSELMGLLPFSLLGSFPQLKPIKDFSHVGKMHAITWKGSNGMKFLKRLR